MIMHQTRKMFFVLAGAILLLGAGCAREESAQQPTESTASSDQEMSQPSARPTAPAPTIEIETDDGTVFEIEATPAVSEQNAPQSITVQMTAQGFSPEMVRITRGSAIVFMNTDTQQHWPASDVHPT